MKQAKRQTVLIADDQNDNLVLINLWLQNLDYLVVTAVNGEDAVEVAKIARPDLILMDIAMPLMDGLEATQKIRETPGISNTPIIFLTAFDNKEFRERAGRAGGDGYLTKPIYFERLSNLIQTLLPTEAETPKAEPKSPDAEVAAQPPEKQDAATAPENFISEGTGNLDPRFMLWRMFCAQNNVSLDMLPSSLPKELQKKWQQLKKQPRPLLKL